MLLLFNSIEFLLLFPVVVVFYYLIKQKYRWTLLLAASIIFYMAWNPIYIFLIFLTIMTTYAAGRLIEAASNKKHSKIVMIFNLLFNFGILFVFKYFNFFSESVHAIFANFGVNLVTPHSELLLPMGISFYTFQSIGYTIDVYRDEKCVEKHFGIYSLYILFFPQLVAGPIERSDSLIPQFKVKHYFNYDQATDGLRIMAIGFLKKIVIADNIAVYVNSVYNNVDGSNGFAMILATLLFAIQIYCDFSGYSDIAVGCAKVMGFELMENFKSPYFSKSVPEFWRRWHISLSSWFKDYLYIPLGGNRVGKFRSYFNILVVFVLSGIWHGANITFLVWGFLHSIYQMASKFTGGARQKFKTAIRLNQKNVFYNAFQTLFTLILICFAWIFFRSNTISDAFNIIGKIFSFDYGISEIFDSMEVFAKSVGTILSSSVVLACMLFLFIIDILKQKHDLNSLIKKRPVLIRWAVYFIVVGVLFFFRFTGAQSFIYFQF